MDKNENPLLISMDAVDEKEVSWLVPGFIPRRSISLLGGDGGAGKSFVWTSIAAAISSGQKVFFDVTPSEFAQCAPERVLFFSSEDSLEHTLHRRLREAGATLSNISTVSMRDERFKDVKVDSPTLRTLVAAYRPALLILDPLQAFLGEDVQMCSRNQMRAALNPLAGVSEEFNVSVLIICHTNKRTKVWGRSRLSDSSDIWDISRSVMICGETDDGNRYLSLEKHNYSEPMPTTIFKISDGKIEFLETSCLTDRDFVIAQSFDARTAPQRADARQFIVNFLKDGEKLTSELDDAAVAEGISKGTLTRAKTELRRENKLKYHSTGFGNAKRFYCRLVENVP